MAKNSASVTPSARASRLITSNVGVCWPRSEFTDEYQAELRRVIDAKVAGEEVVVTENEAPAKVVVLMDALRKSLDSASKSKKKPAKAIEKRAAPRKRKRA